MALLSPLMAPFLRQAKLQQAKDVKQAKEALEGTKKVIGNAFAFRCV